MENDGVLWEGKLSSQGTIAVNQLDLDDVVKNILSRSQLRTAFALLEANPTVSPQALITILLLHEQDHSDAGVLASYGLVPPPPMSPRDEAIIACRDRDEIEAQVLSLIHRQ